MSMIEKELSSPNLCMWLLRQGWKGEHKMDTDSHTNTYLKGEKVIAIQVFYGPNNTKWRTFISED